MFADAVPAESPPPKPATMLLAVSGLWAKLAAETLAN
jgi:hypothetical protein